MTAPDLSDPAPTVDPMEELTDQERSILAFERQWWKHMGAKDTEIRRRFGLSPHVYYLTLNTLIDRPAALAYDPMVVKRLTRLRQKRRGLRTG